MNIATLRPKGAADPLYEGTLIDSNMFNEIGNDRPDQRLARHRMLELREEGYSIIQSHSVKAEIEHENTPSDVRHRSSGMAFTIDTANVGASTLCHVEAILRGNGTSDKHNRDAAHCCDAAFWGTFFVTLDQRILDKRDEVRQVLTRLWIVTPCEWMANYEHHRAIAPYGEEDLRDLIG